MSLHLHHYAERDDDFERLYGEVHERSPALAERLIEEFIADSQEERRLGALEREQARSISAASSFRRTVALFATWTVVIGALIFFGILYYLKPDWIWLIFVLIAVGGPAAVSIWAKNTTTNVSVSMGATARDGA